MAQGYNLTVQLNLQGPKNLNNIVNNINQKLNNIQATVNVKTSPQTAQILNNIANSSKGVKQGADEASSAMERFGKSAGLAIKRFGAFTAATAGFYAIARATSQSLAEFIEYDRQITRIAQVTGTTKDAVSDLSNEITRLSTSLGVSSASLAQVAVTLSQAGLSANQTQQALEALALTTLGASFEDINNTVEGSIALMRQFSISTNQLEAALGSINSVAAAFAVEAGDIITAIQRTGGVFAAASSGISQGTDALNEFIAVFTSVRATTRESAETIATGLRTIFTRLQREDTLDALKEFGIVLTDLEGKFVGPYKAIELISKGLRTLDTRSISFSSLVEELGGFRQVGKVIPLIQQFSTAQQALNVAQQGSGSLAKDAALGQEALAVQIAKVQEEFNALIRSIGQTSEFKQFIRLSLDLASALIQVADAVKPVLPAIAALGAIGIGKGIAPLAKGFRGGLGFNKGGLVPGSGNTDSISAELTPGEYVIRKKAVQAIGVGNLERMNKYAQGGRVKSLLPVKPSLESVYDIGTEDFYSGITVERQISNKLPYSREEYREQAENILNNASSIYATTGSVAGANRFVRRKVGLQLPSRLGPKDLDPSNQQPNRLNKIQGTLAEKDTYNTGNFIPLPTSAGADFSIGGSSVSFAETKNRMDTVSNEDLKGKALLAHQYLTKNNYKNSATDNVPPLNIVLYSSNEQDYPASRRKKRAMGGRISGKDTVPALLTPGEYVLNKKAASTIGTRKLNELNQADKLYGYNKGGLVGFAGGGSVGSPGAYGFPKTGTNPNSRQQGRDGGGILDSTIGKVLLLQGAVSGLTAAIDDSSANAVAFNTSLQGLTTGVNTGIVAFQILGKVGKVGAGASVALGGLLAIDGIIQGIGNSADEFSKKVGQETFTKSLAEASQNLAAFSKNAGNAAAAAQFLQNIAQASQAARTVSEAESGRQTSLRQLFIDQIAGVGASGLGEEREAAASRVRARQGISGVIGEIFDPVQFNKEVESELARTRSASAEIFSNIRSQLLQLAEIQVGRGANLQDVFRSLDTTQRANIARANPQVSEQIDRAGGENTAAGMEIINREVIRQLQISLGPALTQRFEQSLQNIALQTERSLSRIFTTIENSFGAVADSVQRKFDSIDVSLQGLSGSFKPGLAKPQSLTALENPAAFEKSIVTSAIKNIAPVFGTQQTVVSGLAQASFNIEQDLATSLNRVLSGATLNTEPEQMAKTLDREIKNIIQGYGLQGTDIEKVVTDQVLGAVAELRERGKDTISPQDIQQLIDGVLSTIPSLKKAQDLIIKATANFASSQQTYVDKINQIAEVRIQQEQYLIQANSILRNSVLELNKALGKDIGIKDISQNFFENIADLTGGATRPQDIFDNLQRLSQTQESLIARRDALAGKPDERSVREFQALSQELLNTTVAISQNRSALEQLANSSVVASAALGKIQEVQQQRQQQVQFLEKLVSAGPEESERFRQTFDALNAVAQGQTLTLNNSTAAQNAYIDALRQGKNVFEAQLAARGALSQQRGDILGLAKELAPFMKDTQAGRDLQASLLESFLRDTGNLTPQFQEIVDAMRKPQEDPKIKPLIDIYNRASALQANADIALGNLVDVDKTLITTNNMLISAINKLSLTISGASARDVASGVQPADRPQDPVPVQIMPDPVPRPRPRVPPWIEDPIRRSSGGVVYASKGSYIGAKPKGTDTVPAMLTRGEFVVNKNATKKNLPLLEAINGNKTAYASKGGMIYAQEGGQVPWFMGINPEEWFNQQVAMLQQQAGMGVQRVVPLQAIARLRGQAAFIQMQQQAYEYQRSMMQAQQLMVPEIASQLAQHSRLPGKNRANLLKPIIGMNEEDLRNFVAKNPAQAQRMLALLQNLSAIEDKQKKYQETKQRQQGTSTFRPLKGNFATVPSSERTKAKQQEREKQLLADYQKAKTENPTLRARDYAYDERLTQDEEDFLLKATSGIGLTEQDTVAARAYSQQKEKERKARLDAKAEELATRLRKGMTEPKEKPTPTKPDAPLPPQPEKPRESVADIRKRVRDQREAEERKNRAAKYGLPPDAKAKEVNDARKAERAAFRQKQAWVAEWRSIVAKRKSGQTVYWTETSFNNPEAVGYIRSLGFQFADELDEYLPATNVTGDVGGRIPSTQDLSAMSEMANRTGNSIGTQAITTANMAYPGLDEQQLGRFLSGVRAARNRPRSSLPASAVTSNYGDGYSVTSYPDGTVQVNVPSATEVADRTKGVWFDANGNRVNPGEAQITGMGGRVDPSRGTIVDKPLYERSMLATDLASTFGGVAGVSPAGRTRYQPNMPTKPTLPPGTRLVRNTVIPGTNVTTPTIEVGANYPPGSISTSVIGGGRPQISSQKSIGPSTKVLPAPKPATQIDYNGLRSSGLSHDEAMMYLPKTAPGAERGFQNTYNTAEIGSTLARPIGLTPVSKPTTTTVQPTTTGTKTLPTNIDPSKLSDKAKKSLTDQGYEIPTQLQRDLARAQLEREQATKPETLQVLPNETPQEAAKRVAEIKALKPGSTTDPTWKRRGFRIAQPTQPIQQTNPTTNLPQPVPLTPKPKIRQSTKPTTVVKPPQTPQTNQTITVRGFSATEAADTLQLRMQQIVDTLASYASTQEKAKELKANQGLFPVKQLNVSDNPTFDFYDPKAGKTVRAPVRGLYNANTEAMSIATDVMQKAASGGEANVLTHELVHSFQKSSLGMKKAADVPKSLSGPDVDLAKFLDKGGQYEQLRDKVISAMGGKPMDSGMYTANQIAKKPIELMTSMAAAAVNQPEIFKQFPAAQSIMKQLMIAHGYENGGVVTPKYLSTGGQLVNYEPRGTDTIPAMLSKGEFVVNREATKKNLGLLRAINRSRGGKVKNGVLYAEDGTNNPIGNINSSFSSSGDMNVSGRIQVDIPTPTMPQIGTADPTMVNNLQTFSVSLQNFVSQGINPFITASSNFATKIQSQISASNIPGTQPMMSPTTSSAPTTAFVQAPQIDFTLFTNGIQSFGNFAQPLTQALQTLSQLDFGVINNGALAINTSATTLGQTLGRLNASINGFSEKTNEFINRMGSLKLDGTITVGGTISMQPLQVDIAGLEAIEARIQGFAPLIISNIALALEQDNPGMNTTSLKASTTLY